MANRTGDVQLLTKNKGESNTHEIVGGTTLSPAFLWLCWNWLARNRQFVFWHQLIRWKKKKHNDDNNTTPPNNNNNNKTNGYSGVDAAAAICYRRNGHGKCPAGAAANELKKAWDKNDIATTLTLWGTTTTKTTINLKKKRFFVEHNCAFDITFSLAMSKTN